MLTYHWYVLNIGSTQNYAYLHINNDVLPVVDQVSDLGGIWSTDYGLHTSTLRLPKRTSVQIANAIHRAFVSRDDTKPILVRAFLVYVRPIVEYNSIIWSPHLKQDIEAIENVQRWFTKRLPGFKKFSYQERLRRLDLPSLKLRRLHCALLWCYKILFVYSLIIETIIRIWPNSKIHYLVQPYRHDKHFFVKDLPIYDQIYENACMLFAVECRSIAPKYSTCLLEFMAIMIGL